MAITEVKSKDEFKVTGNWNEQAKMLKEKYAQLTDADLKFEAGKENDLLFRIASRINKKRDEVINILKKCQTVKA